METQPNQGTCTTINRLLSLAQGEYIGLIASGDRRVIADWEMAFAEDLRKDIRFGLGAFRVYGSFFARFSVLTLLGWRRIVSWTPQLEREVQRNQCFNAID